MTIQRADKILLAIQDAAADITRDPRRRLDRVMMVIYSQRCSCNGGWQRGGNRQGSALCQKCYERD